MESQKQLSEGEGESPSERLSDGFDQLVVEVTTPDAEGSTLVEGAGLGGAGGADAGAGGTVGAGGAILPGAGAYDGAVMA